VNVPNLHVRADGSPDHNAPRNGVEVIYDDPGCSFLAFEKGNPITSPEIVEPERQNQGDEGSHVNPFGTQQWYPREQQIPSRERGSGPDNAANGMVIAPMMYTPYVENQGSDANDMSVSSNPDGQSNRPTPNSSSNASEQRRSVAGTGPIPNSGGVSFNASPIGSHQSLGVQGSEMDTSRTPFFPDHGFGPGMTPGMTPGRAFAIPDTPSNDFSMPNGWESGQAGMTPRTAEAIMQGLNMPMDSLEMNWDAGT
jgi:hypothetical protein